MSCTGRAIPKRPGQFIYHLAIGIVPALTLSEAANTPCGTPGKPVLAVRRHEECQELFKITRAVPPYCPVIHCSDEDMSVFRKISCPDRTDDKRL